MAWKGYKSYGKSALNVQFDLRGFDKLLAKIQKAGNDIDNACEKAVNASLPIVEADMKSGASRHIRTGEVYNAIESIPAKKSGNYIYGQVGVNLQKHPNAIHAVFQEYGDGHSLQFPDPFVRPAFDNKKEIRKIQRQVLKKEGVPID